MHTLLRKSNYLVVIVTGLTIFGLWLTSNANAQNLLTNGDFNLPNSNASPSGWTTWAYANKRGNAWANRSNDTNGFDGSFYMQVGSNENGTSGAGVYQIIPGAPGLSYDLSVESSAQAWWWPKAEMRLFFLDAASNILNEAISDVTENITAYDRGLAWSNYTLTAISPPGTAYIKVEFTSESGTGTVFFDKAVITGGPSATQPLPNGAEILSASSPYGEAVATRNISYVSHPTSRQNFDLYLPKNQAARPFPLIFWIHGGAWMMGIKDWDNVKYLVRHGYAIASIDYRITPEDRFPAQIQDCNAALNFILAHATNYGINPNQLIVAGGSAGGHLALLLGLARHEPDFGADPSIKPVAILDFFGPTDFNKMADDLKAIHSEKGIELLQDAGTKLFGAPVEQSSGEAKIGSPINYVNSASPPILILHGGTDDLVPVAQSRRLHEALDLAGVKNQLIIIDNAGHDGPLFATPEIQSKVINFLNGFIMNSNGQASKTYNQ